MSPLLLALAAVFAPALAALILAVLPPLRSRGWPAAALCLISTLVAGAASVTLLALRLGGAGDFRAVAPWLVAGGRTLAEVGLQVDAVSAPMLVVVTLVAFCVQVFSTAYMHEETPRAYGRYFTLMALFLFSMNLLVAAPNLLQLFGGWELVGLSSYLLIGFYFHKPSAARAAVKAFWMTKLADMGFFFALLLLYVSAGAFEWTSSLAPGVATAVTGLLFFAVLGKSAQFPLHIWLPDAMEGPTPVSALLHAATMVAAGVFMVVRADPLFAQAPATREVMLWTGVVTSVFAAGLALVQQDIKKVLAFSTCSQLGYMVAALGAGSAFAGFFHLGTHALFKALLFLAAGSVIHAVHSNDLSQMGGLRKRLPVTATTFGVGVLAIAGAPGFAGFFSKDAVLASLEGRDGWVPWLLLMACAFLTALYMGRVFVLAFLGSPKPAAEHEHEGGIAMTGPLVVLAALTFPSGFLGAFFARSVGAEYELHLGLTPLVASTLAVAGLVLAVMLYGAGRKAPLTALLERLDRASAVDRTFEAGYRGVLLGLAGVFAWLDRYVVDGAVNFLGWGAIEAGARARRLQTGKVGDYAFALVVGVALLVLWGRW
jgi:NADH-quinone oxidoreductase subunit L